MRAVAAFVALPGRDRVLLLRAVATVAAVRLALHLFTVDRLRAWAGRLKPGKRPVDRIVWAVSAASRWLPGTTCLGSALALQRLLSGEGHASELHIGVARSGEQFSAHAWLACEGRILIGEPEHDRFTRLVTWRVVEGPAPAAGKSGPA
ncbi:MAG: lasso peptide biosynthesis B2 protein [Reyranella sp.]|nr:lasso peptide biosynthesis B2 protein [Reyranella sp.]